jgi:hypothetical protein
MIGVYRYTSDMLLGANHKFDSTNLETILSSEALKKMVRRGRLAGEEAVKLKDMREHKFGKLSFQVPAVDTQRKPNIPLPSSTAQPYLGSKGDPKEGFVDADNSTWEFERVHLVVLFSALSAILHVLDNL